MGHMPLPCLKRDPLLLQSLVFVIDGAMHIAVKMREHCKAIFARDAERCHASRNGAPKVVGRRRVRLERLDRLAVIARGSSRRMVRLRAWESEWRASVSRLRKREANTPLAFSSPCCRRRATALSKIVRAIGASGTTRN